jgi:hypothetical protein
MARLLAAAVLAVGMLATVAPAANACAWEHCPVTGTVCAEYGCPVYCTPRDPVTDTEVCVL